MISEENLRNTMNRVLGSLAKPDFPYWRVAETLSRFEQDNGMRLSAYGYVMWAVDHHGYKCAYSNLMASANVTGGYCDAAKNYRDDMPAMLVNANLYATKILSNVADLDTCLRQLEGMTFPYVLYTLFTGTGQVDVVERYRNDFQEHMRRYPSTLDLLPESFRKVGDDILAGNADTQ